MPLYEFQCEKCKQHFGLFAPFAQKEKGLAPRTGAIQSAAVDVCAGVGEFAALDELAHFFSAMPRATC